MLALPQMMPGVSLHLLPSDEPTTFMNLYQGDDRQQFVRHVAPSLTWSDIPPEWREPPIVHLAPVAREVDVSLLGCFSRSLLGVTPQGWLRRWDEGGRVLFEPLAEASTVLQPADVLVFSIEDVACDLAAMEALIAAVPVAVVTRAAAGCVVYTNGVPHLLAGRAATVVDPTGAGDVFAAAFFIRLSECGEPLLAGSFANIVASFSIERAGVDGIPSREMVEAWAAENRESV
jgi:sugar/nucleoside kinase (ribokinase family)